jgi:DNA-binding GntR family transcriptional regulator
MRWRAATTEVRTLMNTDRSIASQIVEVIQTDGLQIGSHLPAQMLADRLRVSRSPVNEALSLLHEKGIVRRERNRGFFVAQAVTESPEDLASQLGLSESDVVTSAYFRIADDRLKGVLADDFTELSIRNRYELTNAQLNAVLGRIANPATAGNFRTC